MRDGLLEDFHAAGLYLPDERKPMPPSPLPAMRTWGFVGAVFVSGAVWMGGSFAEVGARVRALEESRFELMDTVVFRGRIEELDAEIARLEALLSEVHS